MLSAEERAALLEEAADPRRREVLRAARARAARVLERGGALAFLQSACDLFAPRAAAIRRRPRAGGQYRL